MAEGVIVIVDLGHEDCQMIKEDVEFFGVGAVICEHDVDQAYLSSLGEIRGIILNGGPNKTVGGFRLEASEAIYDSKLPMYSVDHASAAGVDLYQWPADKAGRQAYIKDFLIEKCSIDQLK